MSKPRSTKLETQERIRYVQECILNDISSSDILRSVIEKWGVTDRQAYRYLWAANRFFQEKDQQSLQSKKAFYLSRKRRLLRDMDGREKKTAKGVQVANKVLDSMAKLEGITNEKTLKLIGDPAKPLQTVAQVSYTSTIDYSKMPTEFLEYIVANRKTANV